MLKDSLTIMDLTKDARVKEVRSRYREMCFTLHPDRGGTVHEFTKLTLAYQQVLDYAQNAPCAKCHGKGHYFSSTKSYPVMRFRCDMCNGTGRREGR